MVHGWREIDSTVSGSSWIRDSSLKEFDPSGFNEEDKKFYDDIADDAKEHAEQLVVKELDVDHVIWVWENEKQIHASILKI